MGGVAGHLRLDTNTWTFSGLENKHCTLGLRHVMRTGFH